MIHGVVARRGIQAIQLTHETRYNLTDLVQGKLHQHARLEPGQIDYTFELIFDRGGHSYTIKQGEWLIFSPQGFVAILDDFSFQSWFETVALYDAAGASLAASRPRTGD